MISILFRKYIFSTYQYIRKYYTWRCLKEIRKTQWFPEEKLQEFQWMRLEKLLKNSYLNVPYYKNLFDDIGINAQNSVSIEDFQKIPLLNKDTIITNKDKLISTKYITSDLMINTTSGSTGKKLVFYNEKKGVKRNDYFTDAAVLRNLEWLGVSIFDNHVTLWGPQMDTTKSKGILRKIHKFIFPSLILLSFGMSNQTMKSYAEKINKYEPKVIMGYASALYTFAKFLKENQIQIYNPKGIISSAETLFDQQRNLIESVFKCKVFNRYGCREFASIAQECEHHNGLHLNIEHIYMEILDKEGKPCEPGQLGKIVITDLDNYGFPFIRYEIGDIGIFSDNKCNCGRGLPLLEKIEGRAFDIIVGTNEKYFTGTFWTILLRTYIKGIQQFQVIQENFGKLIIKIVTDGLFTENEKDKLLKYIHENCGEKMKVDIQLVDDIPLTESGKNRFIISKISPFQNQ